MAAPEAPPPAAPESAAEPGAAATSPPTSLEEKAEQAKPGLAQAEPAPATIPEAEKAFSEAQGQLEKLIGPVAAKPVAGAEPPAPLAQGDARCPRACKAFDSLRRAGDAICRLAGDKDARCSRARGVIKQSQTRVTACGCSMSGPEP
jgi:hypothetical protein